MSRSAAGGWCQRSSPCGGATKRTAGRAAKPASAQPSAAIGRGDAASMSAARAPATRGGTRLPIRARKPSRAEAITRSGPASVPHRRCISICSSSRSPPAPAALAKMRHWPVMPRIWTVTPKLARHAKKGPSRRRHWTVTPGITQHVTRRPRTTPRSSAPQTPFPAQ
jgi:hypothetical protein